MKIIIGTYRADMAMIVRALGSIQKNLSGFHEVVFVDDSGRPEFRKWLGHMGRVVPVGMSQRGYGEAMSEVCAEAGDDEFMFWEEDFVLTEPTDLLTIRHQLIANPDVSQVVLLRQPWFPNEVVAGDVVTAMEERLGVKCEVRGGLLVHDGTFSCNPAVWRAGVAAGGWPTGKWSEDQMTVRLLEQGMKFAWMRGERVTHDGERQGFGY